MNQTVKLWDEFKKVWVGMKPHYKRLFAWNPKDVAHAYVNLFVESRRISPYFMGHVDSLFYPVLIGLCIYLGIR